MNWPLTASPARRARVTRTLTITGNGTSQTLIITRPRLRETIPRPQPELPSWHVQTATIAARAVTVHIVVAGAAYTAFRNLGLQAAGAAGVVGAVADGRRAEGTRWRGRRRAAFCVAWVLVGGAGQGAVENRVRVGQSEGEEREEEESFDDEGFHGDKMGSVCA